MNTAVCVLIINTNNKDFLAVSLKEDHTDFNLPGGKVEMNESFEEAAIREVKEETGMNIYNLKFLYEGMDDDYQVITFFAYNYDGSIYTKENHVVKWLPIYDLTKSNKWPVYNTKIYEEYLKINIKN